MCYKSILWTDHYFPCHIQEPCRFHGGGSNHRTLDWWRAVILVGRTAVCYPPFATVLPCRMQDYRHQVYSAGELFMGESEKVLGLCCWIVFPPTQRHLKKWIWASLDGIFSFKGTVGPSHASPQAWNQLLSGWAIFSSPCISALSAESRSVPVMVSISRLPSYFPLGWIATCVVLFTHSGGFWRVEPDFKWRFPAVDILMLWCMHVGLLRKVYAPHNVGVFLTFYVCTNYYIQSNSLHEMALLPKWSIIYLGRFWRVASDFKL